MKKTLNLPQIIALYIGSVIGSGILLVPGLAADFAGPASLIAWLAMSILVIPMAITMGLLAAKHPSSGGVSHFVRLAFGDHFGNMVGWFFLLSVPIGGPVLAVTGAKYVTAVMHWGHDQVFLIAAALVFLPLLMNVVGMKLAGKVQIVVIVIILTILLLAISTSAPHYNATNFEPFMPSGWISVAQAAGLLFWCFIGWEAVTHLSAEFVDPRKNAIRGVIWSAGIVGILYFGVAFMTVATHSYGGSLSVTALSTLIQLSLGEIGGWLVALAALFIGFATHNAYFGAASRVAAALAEEGAAPKLLGKMHRKYDTPIGGLALIAIGSTLGLLALYFDWISLAQLIVLPNATFVATYMGGCLAGIKLLKDTRIGYVSAWISLLVTLVLYPFLGWSALYPIAIVVIMYVWKSRKQVGVNLTR
ncbi:amino acid permease [Paenibacillus sp. N1-5-1-14]|uniref:APC family permease n=1 Tax=Paenibacillus radicibacter TaxID=2972488 RepID=UPI002158BFAC|nr:amino acid permease [Paenibacillus radicibacter]MCR8642870.1 amino acid permease [Paenibacillus radicibacter]